MHGGQRSSAPWLKAGAVQADVAKVHRRLQKPRSSLDLAADVVERAARTGEQTPNPGQAGMLHPQQRICWRQRSRAAGGERYLDTRADELRWWQRALLDAYAALAAACLALAGLVCLLAWGGYRGARGCPEGPPARWQAQSAVRFLQALKQRLSPGLLVSLATRATRAPMQEAGGTTNIPIHALGPGPAAWGVPQHTRLTCHAMVVLP